MRRGVAGSVVAVAAALSLMACSSGGPGAGEGENGSTLTIWHYFRAGGQLEALEAQNQLFRESNPDVELDVVEVPSDQVVQRLLATASTQEGPDVLFDNVVVDFPTLAGSGVLHDLTDYWNGYDEAGQFPDSAIWEFEDGIYNVMSYANLLALYYNEDALEESGIEPPQTIDEFDEALRTVNEDGQYTPLIVAGDPGVTTAWSFFPQLLGEGVDYCSIDEPAVQEVFERVESWAAEGIIPPDAASYDQTDAWQPFMTGNYAFAINGNWNLAAAADADFDVGTVRYPAGSEGSHVFPGGEGIAIGAFSENPDLAWEYIQAAFLSEEGSQLNYENSGQIPLRSDVAGEIDFEENPLILPFVEATQDTGAWPENENTAQMQMAFGQAISSLISGQTTATDAAQEAVANINSAREEGGGGC